MPEIFAQAVIKLGLMLKYAFCAYSIYIICYLNNSKMTLAKLLASSRNDARFFSIRPRYILSTFDTEQYLEARCQFAASLAGGEIRPAGADLPEPAIACAGKSMNVTIDAK